MKLEEIAATTAIRLVFRVILSIGTTLPLICSAQNSDAVSSNTVEFHRTRYKLVEDATLKTLTMWLHLSGDEPARPGRAIEVTNWSLPEGHRLENVHLAVWYDISLFGIITTYSDNTYHVNMLMFEQNLLPLINISIAVNKPIYSSPEPLTLLAVNGRFQGDGIVVVVGSLTVENGQRVPRTTAIYIDDCPAPNLKSGKVSVLTK